MWGLAAFYLVRGEPLTGIKVSEECLQLSERLKDPTLLGYAHFLMGDLLLWLGNLSTARHHLEQGLAVYNPARDRPQAMRYGFDLELALYSFLGRVLWHLGFCEQARAHARKAVTAAQACGHAFGIAWAFAWAAAQYQLLGDAELCLDSADAAVAVATEQIIPFYRAHGMVLGGWALVKLGQRDEGLARLRAGIETYRSTGSRIEESHWQALLIDAYLETGRIQEGLSAVRAALDGVEETAIRYYEPELNRLQGAIFLEIDEVQSEICFRRAIDLARAQQAKSFELRSALSLACLWQRQGQHTEARDLLAPIWAWFTEGFDTTDLRKGKALLQAYGT